MVPATYRHWIFYIPWGDVTRGDSQQRFLAQQSITALLHIVLNSCNMVPTLQRRVELIIIVTLSPLADTSPKQTFSRGTSNNFKNFFLLFL